METIVNIDLLSKLTVEGRNKILSTAKQEFENETMCGKVYSRKNQRLSTLKLKNYEKQNNA